MNNHESNFSAEQALLNMARQTQDEFYFPDGSEIELTKAVKLSKDLKTEIKNIESISKSEIRTLVNLYYQVQDFRKASREQIRAIEQHRSGSEKSSGNVAILDWANSNMAVIEKGIVDSLELICMSRPEGQWLMMTSGIGPVLAAGLLGYYDISHAKYATSFISYGGLNDNNRPWLGREKSTQIINEILDGAKVITNDHVVDIAARTQWKYEYLLEKAFNQEKQKWSKEDIIKACSKIPYNADLKTHLWKVGASFQWLCNNPNSLYGRLFNERRVLETQKNERGEYAEQAAKKLREQNIGKGTEAYKCYSQGKLPKAHITARAMRWTEKIFVSHLFEEMYRVEYDQIPPRYYSLVHLEGQHNVEIEPEVPYHLTLEEKGTKDREKMLEELLKKREENEVKMKAVRKAKREAKALEEGETMEDAKEFF